MLLRVLPLICFQWSEISLFIYLVARPRGRPYGVGRRTSSAGDVLCLKGIKLVWLVSWIHVAALSRVLQYTCQA